MGLRALDAFCKTLTNWLDKIANYFINRSSNGRTGGIKPWHPNHSVASLWHDQFQQIPPPCLGLLKMGKTLIPQ